MILTAQHTHVVIVGAGPSGLMMAAQLLRYGEQPVIIDSKQGPTNESKALAVQARSLEIYRQMGLIGRVLEDGKPAEGVTFNRGAKKIASFSFGDAGKDQTPFPYVYLYQQSNNEKLLLDFLTLNCCPVYWETNLISLKQNEQQVEFQLQSADRFYTLTCDWLIVADGAHSTVRKQLQIPFNGDTYRHEFYLADVELENEELNDNKVRLCFDKKGFAAFFPMPEHNRYRVISNLPDLMDNQSDLKVDDIVSSLNDISGLSIQIKQTFWFVIYHLHHRMADKFREQRCFLVGDAAHIHSPVGGQGMNTGLQDAYNLAWKLAGVIQGKLKKTVLDSYAAERIPVARSLLNTTDKIFTMVMSETWYARFFKRYVAAGLLKFAWSKQGIKKAFFKHLSQININYRDSAVSLHLSHATKIKAGDRLPYLKIFNEKKQEETDLHEWCNKLGFTLMIFGKLSETDLFTLAKWITQNYSITLNFFYLPPSAKNMQVFETFEISKNQVKSVIVRPDMYIGFINDQVDMLLMDNYLQNMLGVM